MEGGRERQWNPRSSITSLELCWMWPAKPVFLQPCDWRAGQAPALFPARGGKGEETMVVLEDFIPAGILECHGGHLKQSSRSLTSLMVTQKLLLSGSLDMWLDKQWVVPGGGHMFTEQLYVPAGYNHSSPVYKLGSMQLMKAKLCDCISPHMCSPGLLTNTNV